MSYIASSTSPSHEEAKQPFILPKDSSNVLVVPSRNNVTDNNGKRFASITKHQHGSLFLRQCLAAAGPVVFTIGSGMTSGYSAVLLPQLRADDSELPITDEEASWIASMAALPMAAGCLVGGFLMERIGRRRTSLLLCLPAILGWLLMACAQDLRMLLAGRFLTGFALGAFSPVGLVYIGETSSPQNRGVLLAATAFSVSFGILLAHVLGAFLQWRIAAGACTVAPVLGLIFIFIAPESPAWLAGRGERSQAEEIFEWLRGTDTEATTEFHGIISQQQQQTSINRVTLSKQLVRPSFFKPFIFMNLFFVIQQFSGVNAVAFYTVAIFQQTLGGSVDEYVAMGVLDIARVFMSVIACVLLRRFGRRPLAVFSAIGTGLSLLALAAFLRFGSQLSSQTSLLSWTPVLLLVLYMCFVSIGLVPLPWVMTGEVFPAAVRGIGSGSTSCVGFLVFFAVVKSGPAMFSNLGSDGTFLIYGIIAAIGAVYLYFCCPETKNKTLQDIENKFNEQGKTTTNKV